MEDKWRIVDNYHEKIFPTEYNTEKEAELVVADLIKGHKIKGESYDYNVDKISPRMRYHEYVNGEE